jgi:HK97 family phage portal protein
MNIFNKFLSKKQEKKNLSPIDTAWDFGNMYDYFTNSQNYLITKILAVSYYTKCSPLFNAIDMIATAISSIPPRIYDKEQEIWVKNHPLLDLLKLPNADITWEEFIYSLVSFYIVTGDAYIVASGKPGTPPKELYSYPSQAVTVLPGKDGFVQTLQTTLYWGTDIYTRNEVDNRFRYYNTPKTAEIWHIKHFNPTTIQGNVYGMSPLNPIYYEINQHQSANRHNLSVLERGATPSGIMSLNPSVDQDAFERLQQQMEKTHAGAANAGRMMLLNWGIDYKPTTITNKDMDFLELKKEVTNAIYKNLKIPLALVNTDSMTLDNFDKSMIAFYDQAVLPTANRIFSELSTFLLSRYGNNDNLILSYDAGDITALEPRRNEQMKVLKELGIFTINQLRAVTGADPLIGGNAIYGQSAQIPLATDPADESVALNYDELPALDIVGGNDEKLGAKKTSRAKFVGILKAKLDAEGNPLFTDEEINKIADKHGLE